MKRLEKGQVILIFSFLMVAVLFLIALALDCGGLFVQRRNAQTAADDAAFTGAAALMNGSTPNQAEALAAQRAASNGFNNDQVTNWVTVNYPPADGPFSGDTNRFQVIIKARLQTAFIQLFIPGSAGSTTQSVVHFTERVPAGGPNALIGLSKTDCDTVLANGNMNILVQGGNVFSNSNANGPTCYSMEKKGTSGVVNVVGGGIDIVGAFNNTSLPSSVTPAPVTGVTPFKALSLAPPDCTCNKNLSGSACANSNVNVNGNITIYPGIYQDITLTSSNDNLTLEPGLYCINGNFTASKGSLSGSNVIIVMEGGTLNLAGDVSNSISASTPPPAGPKVLYWSADGSQYDYAGLLVYANPAKYSGISDSNSVVIGGANGSIFTGTVYAPNTTCTLSGTSGSIIFNSQIGCYTVTVSGNADININFSANQNWSIPSMLDLEY